MRVFVRRAFVERRAALGSVVARISSASAGASLLSIGRSFTRRRSVVSSSPSRISRAHAARRGASRLCSRVRHTRTRAPERGAPVRFRRWSRTGPSRCERVAAFLRDGGRRGAARGVRRGDADRGRRRAGRRLRARPDREVARPRLRRPPGRRAGPGRPPSRPAQGGGGRAGGASARTARAAARSRPRPGFEPGAVAPFPLPQRDRVLIERTLLAHDVVWIGAGSDRAHGRARAGRARRLAHARPIDAVQDGA